ncbi:MAG: TraB/GumN family protein [Proteobacteria bacterium]|nr:TraB/GumN family protein [Pseudomonadota bacterium]
MDNEIRVGAEESPGHDEELSASSQDTGSEGEAGASVPDVKGAETLPESSSEMPSHVVVIEDGDRTYRIIGTAHVSERSRQEVASLIETVKPDVVCIELCQERYESFLDANRWSKLDIFQVIRRGKFLYLLASLALSAYQRKLGAKLGVKPGAELLEAAQVASANGAEIAMIDRNINVTLKRVWGGLGFWTKINLMSAIMESLISSDKKSKLETTEEIEKLKEAANLSAMMDTFAKELPQVHEPLIDERDRYLVAKMRACGGKNVVAVVGAGHVAGMQRYFHTPIDVAALDTLPKPGMFWPLFKWLFPVLLLGSMIYGVSTQGFGSLESILMAWVLPNSLFCLFFCLLAGAKPLTLLASIFVSPITSICGPLINAGMVLGLLEAWLRKPSVSDCERLVDVHGIKDFYRNPVTRTLIVALLAVIGSSLGAWAGIGWIAVILGQGG